MDVSSQQFEFNELSDNEFLKSLLDKHTKIALF